MSYQALARKWRPRVFEDVVGQAHVVTALANALESQRLHHAFLFSGTRGVGKTTIARILAKCLNCERGVTAHPCGECAACREIDEGRFVDLIEVDAASKTKVEDTRDLLENVPYAPTRGRYKVYLIDEVHMLSKSAFNSMLKTLEEPPEHVKFVLATTDPQKIPVTVLSRCLQFALKQFPPERVAEQLHKVLTAEQVPFDAPALRLIGEAAQGSMRDALSITDQAIAFGHGKVDEQQVRQMLGNVDRDFVWRVLDAVGARDAAALNAEVERCFEQGLSADDALAQLARALQRIALAQPVPASVDGDDPDAAHILRLAKSLTAEEAQLYYQIALHGRDDLRLAPDEQTALMMTFLRLLAFAPSSGAEPARETAPSPAVARAPAPPPARAAEPVIASATPPASAAPVKRDASPTATSPLTEPAAQDDSGRAAVAREFDGDWLKLVSLLPLAAMARELARHSVLASWDKGLFKLALPQDKRPLATQKERLAGTLSEYFGRAIKIEIELTDNVGESVAVRDNRIKDEKQAAAEAAFMADPAVQVLLNEGGCRVRAGSIQPT